MTLLLLLGGAGGPSGPGPDEGVLFEALGLRVLFEISASQPYATSQDWHDLSGYIHKSSPISVNRGRSNQFDDVRAGTLGLTLDASNGDLDPRNEASPHYNCLKVRRRCRLRVIYDDVVYPVFDGYANGFPRTYRRPNVQGLIPFEATDGFRILNNASPTTGLFRIEDPVYGRIGVGRIAGDTAADQFSGQLIDVLLDTLGWPSALRDIDTGRVLVSGADLAGRGLSGIQEAAKAEGGELYISRDGKVTARDRLARFTEARSVTSQALFYPRKQTPDVAVYDEPFSIAQDETRIINEARYTGTSGSTQTVRDEASVDEYGINDDAQTLIAVNDDDVLSLAVLTVADNAQPADRYEALQVPASTAPAVNMPAVLGRELFDLISLEIESTWGAPNTTEEAVVQGINLTINTASLVAKFRLGPYREHQFLTIGDPTLGAVESVGAIAP